MTTTILDLSTYMNEGKPAYMDLSYVSLEFMSVRNWHMFVWNLSPFRTDININWLWCIYPVRLLHLNVRLHISFLLIYKVQVQLICITHNIVYTLEVTILDFSKDSCIIKLFHVMCILCSYTADNIQFVAWHITTILLNVCKHIVLEF